MIRILDVLDEIVERSHNTLYKIEILALRAVALDAQGKTSQADLELKQAVALARPGAFTKIFVDLGNPMVEMLGRLLKQGYYVETIYRILASFPADGSKPDESVSPEQPGAQRTNANFNFWLSPLPLGSSKS